MLEERENSGLLLLSETEEKSPPHLICTYIENPRKRRTVWELYENTRTKQRLYYNIIPFRRRKMFFCGQSDATSSLRIRTI